MTPPRKPEERPEKLDTTRDPTPYDGGEADTETGLMAQGAPIDVPQSAVDQLAQPQVRPLKRHRQGRPAAGETGEGDEPIVDGGNGSGASEPGGSGGG